MITEDHFFTFQANVRINARFVIFVLHKAIGKIIHSKTVASFSKMEQYDDLFLF
jgi:hypothetical protein